MDTTSSRPLHRIASRRLLAGGLGVLSLTLSVLPIARPVAAQTAPAKAQAPAAASVARGEYLANRVAMCVQCHSGRDAKGVLVDSAKFRGGSIPFKSPWPDSEWAYQAPTLAGLPGFTDEQIVEILTVGRARGRETPRSPMPPFRMSPEDAKAIAAYLRSL